MNKMLNSLNLSVNCSHIWTKCWIYLSSVHWQLQQYIVN